MGALFDPALAKMEAGTPVFGPVSFQGYLLENGLAGKNTAQHISVDSMRSLAPELHAARTMVFRLGSPGGERHTHFSLARCVSGWGDYFLLDQEVFAEAKPQLFIPPVSLRQLFAFTLLPKFTETSLVNLAVASGLLSHVLKLDDPAMPSAPATGQGTYSFTFTPHEQLDVAWFHSKGQVEIDAAIIAKRGGEETLFVVEAKVGDELDSLAKHMLLYPALALRDGIPEYMPLVPVYIRVLRRQEGLHFYIAECSLTRTPGGVASIAGLVPKLVSHHVLLGFNRA
ncbi:MAG: hypothetical protein KF873_12500 [Gemmataceae bacterium]|nr:hypothetical protein [Gemmataceae bacterium]